MPSTKKKTKKKTSPDTPTPEALAALAKAGAPEIVQRITAELRMMREHREVSLDDLAAALEVSPDYLARLEAGVAPLSVPMFARITAALGHPAPTFAGDV